MTTLKVTLNAKGMWTKNRYADGEAIKAARQFDPTQPVYASGYDNSVTTISGLMMVQHSMIAVGQRPIIHWQQRTPCLFLT